MSSRKQSPGMWRRARRGLFSLVAIAVLALLTVVVANSALLFRITTGGDGTPTAPLLIAHRGVHQPFDTVGLTNDTCTAARSLPTDHHYLENTVPSMRAAFALGASVVELDVQLTRDGSLAVFHDWTLDCRTDGSGVTHEATWSELRLLDIGYGYTADGGETYPFRGTGVGMMPRLEDVFEAFPGRSFLIEIKSNDPAVGEALVRFFDVHPAWLPAVWGVYGGPRPVSRFAATHPGVRTFTAGSAIGCLTEYVKGGWTGRVPGVCTDATVYAPVNLTWLLWGWPDRFLSRMRAAGATVVMIGPHVPGNVGTRGFDDPGLLSRLPPSFDGYIQTDRIELLGPATR